MDSSPAAKLALKVSYNSDIRRVSVQRNGLSFEALRAAIKKLYKTLPDEEFVSLEIRYQDDESDWITVSSDEELTEAVSLLPEASSILRLSLVAAPNRSPRGCFRLGGGSGAARGQCPGRFQRHGWQRWCGGRAKFYHLQQHGLRLMESGVRADIEQARSLFQEQLAIFEHQTPIYNIACCDALLGNTDEALVNLEKAINAGFRNVNHIENDEDLKSLRQLDKYKALLAPLKASAPQPPKPAAHASPVALNKPAAAFSPAPSLVKLVPASPAPAPVVVKAPVPVKPVHVPAPVVLPVPSAPPALPVSAPVAIPAPTPVYAYPVAMKALEDMGFLDKNKNVAVLFQAKGDVTRAVQLLLGENPHAWWQ